MSEQQQLTVTPASAWKRKTEVVQLPSGAVAELKKPSVISLALRGGRLPESLSAIVFDSLNGRKRQDTENWKPENPGEIADLMDVICTGAFVNPAIVEQPDYEAGQISIEDVQEEDKLWVLNWAGVGGGELPSARRSPDEQTGSIPVARNVRRLQHQT